jgi:pyruvate/2-oxoglutarate/acetoin dehydrogenase E1 component/TPP-dependent pyruvate/acetoin dehydrogenase alpha subunit
MSDLSLNKDEVLKDYKTAVTSRICSLIGRKEVLGGRAKFGIFGDGKEVAQVALARTVLKGDWRSGYYRDQTFMLAVGQLTVQQFFAQLFADTNIEHEPHSGGRQMNAHFATRYYKDGVWLDQLAQANSSSDISPTGGQMARLLGLAYASKLYRDSEALQTWSGAKNFSKNGDEVVFGTIGNASTSEGLFWETMNAAGVLQVPIAMCVWDDGYGISVPSKFQTTKESISELMMGFHPTSDKPGVDIVKVKGWDYAEMISVFSKGVRKIRTDHRPCLFHIVELTQPQGHSTSGSHERYKSPARLTWEEQYDCLPKMKKWMIESKIADEKQLAQIEKECADFVEKEKDLAWSKVIDPIETRRDKALKAMRPLLDLEGDSKSPQKLVTDLEKATIPFNRAIQAAVDRMLLLNVNADPKLLKPLQEIRAEVSNFGQNAYQRHLYVENFSSPLKIEEILPTFSANSPRVDGRQVIQKFFDLKLSEDPRIFICGEDVGQLGGVNLEFEGLSSQHGDLRVSDTGIREATILGQGMGAAMRGLRPIVDIQYLDYLLYCLQGMSDDLATLHYRTAAGQVSPTIIRTKGHRLEGIWHTGSPIGMILNSIRGIHFCVPRNMVQAAGLYNTLLKGDDPALVIEVLSGYRIKELMPDNLGVYCVPLGKVEVLREGNDITVITYGANCRIALEAASFLEELGIDIEVIDVQTLLPFDLQGALKNSILKTNAVIFLDEDVPGGASAYMMQEVLEKQGAYDWLDTKPRTLTAREHRSAYASDGDYYCKPSSEDIIHLCCEMMNDRRPGEFDKFQKN